MPLNRQSEQLAGASFAKVKRYVWMLGIKTGASHLLFHRKWI